MGEFSGSFGGNDGHDVSMPDDVRWLYEDEEDWWDESEDDDSVDFVFTGF